MAFRRSKFKHIFGKALKRDECYDCIRITKSSWDSTFCSVNPKYLAIITEAAGGGAFLVIPIEKTGRQEADIALVAGHKAAVLDIQFCPHNDDVIASASEDCTIKVWSIPEDWLHDKTNLTEPIANLVGHQRRVGLVLWHPTAENILLSSGADNMVMLWNVSTEEVLVEINFPDMIISACFNFNGSKLVTSCKDKFTRVVDPRTGEIKTEGKCHEGAKPQQVVYLKDDRVFTTGFSRMSERQFALWDDNNFKTYLMSEDIDTSNGVIFPWYDADCNLIYLTGKGDSVIRYFEYSPEDKAVHYINRLDSSDPQRGIGWMPKRGVNVNQNEIARCYKLHNKNLCEVIPFTVPRKSELYQDDLYPDTAADVPAISAEEWLEGTNCDPVRVSMKEGFVTKERTRKPIKASIKSKLSDQKPGPTKSEVKTKEPESPKVEERVKPTPKQSFKRTSVESNGEVDRRSDSPNFNNNNDNNIVLDKSVLEKMQSEIRHLSEIVRDLSERVLQLEDDHSSER